MGAHSSMLHVRIDNEVKAKAIAALEAMGLSASDAVRLLFHRIAADQAFPLELKVPNAETRAAMAEAAEIIGSRKLRSPRRGGTFRRSRRRQRPLSARPFPREVDYAKSFLKDWERLSRSGRYDLRRLKEVMMLLIATGPSLKT